MANQAIEAGHGLGQSVCETDIPVQGVSCQLVQLAIQQEGDSFLVGSLSLNRFFQVPEIGVRVIGMLQAGLGADAIKACLAEDGVAAEDDVDVVGFIDALIAHGLAKADGVAPEAAPGWLRWAEPLARRLFSWPCAVAYLAIVACAVASIIAMPSILPQRHVLLFTHDRTLSVLALLAMCVPVVILHELGHMLAAARRGIASRLGFGNRLWTIVVEVDLTGLLALPRSWRYVPLLAGLAADVFSVSVMFIMLAALVHEHASGYLVQLIQALVLQTVLIMLWQTNVFLRTDLYFVLCTWLGFPDLDRDARRYLGALWRATPALAWAPTPGALRDRLAMAAASCDSPRHLRTVQFFALIWVAGRIVSITILVTLLLPTMAGYVAETYRAVRHATAQSIPTDSLCFSVLFLGLMISGLASWIYQNRPRVSHP